MSLFYKPRHKAQKNRETLKLIDQSLSRQSLPTAILHFTVFLVLEWQWLSVAPTPAVSYLLGLVLVVMASWRFIMIAKFPEWYSRGPNRWRDWFIASGFLHAAAWSSYLFFRLSGVEHPISLLGILYTLTIAAGSTFVYSLYGNVVRVHLAILLWPMVLYFALLAESTGHFLIAIGFMVIYWYLIHMAKRLATMVWGFLRQNHELKLRLRTLEQAREANVLQASSSRRLINQVLYRIKNPLNGLLGVLGVLSDENQSNEQQGMLNIARRSGHSILELLNDLEAFIEQREQSRVPQNVVFNLRKTLEHLLSEMGGRAHEYGLEIAYLYHSDVPERVESEPQWLASAFRRLLDFALDSAVEGEVTVRISMDKGDFGERLLLSFYFINSDIVTKDLQRAVGPNVNYLSQTDDMSDQLTLMVAAAQFKALGATLSIQQEGELNKLHVSLPIRSSSQQASAFRPAEHMAGRSVMLVDMSSINERALTAEFLSWGMSVTVWQLDRLLSDRSIADTDFILLNLPVEEARAQAYILKIEQLLKQLHNHNTQCFLYASELQRGLFDQLNDQIHYIEKPVSRDNLLRVFRESYGDQLTQPDEIYHCQDTRVLLVEDNLVNQKVLVRLLERIGIETETCVNGEEALQLATQKSYHLVLMDSHMPKLDGWQVTQAIRQHELTSGSHIPIIGLTDENTPEQERACLASGMDDFMVKPVTYETLVTVIQRWIG